MNTDMDMNMDFEQQVEEAVDKTKTMVEHWCPRAFHDEPFQHQLWRAFMHLAVCAYDQKQVIEGKEPFQPLSEYPDPSVGFEDKDMDDD